MVNISQFGRDHWSTFGYLETRVVDHGGCPEKRHMRCDPRRHPVYTHLNEPAPPTKLRGRELGEHDDWDCVDDLAEAGLVTIGGTGTFPIWSLTERGRCIAAELRKFKAQGGSFAAFVPSTGCS